MANRHANKKLRAAVRARMASTGEPYQLALARITAARTEAPGAPSDARVDLMEVRVFGHPAVVALVTAAVGDVEASRVYVSIGGAGTWAGVPLRARGGLSGMYRVRRREGAR